MFMRRAQRGCFYTSRITYGVSKAENRRTLAAELHGAGHPAVTLRLINFDTGQQQAQAQAAAGAQKIMIQLARATPTQARLQPTTSKHVLELLEAGASARARAMRTVKDKEVIDQAAKALTVTD